MTFGFGNPLKPTNHLKFLKKSKKYYKRWFLKKKKIGTNFYIAINLVVDKSIKSLYKDIQNNIKGWDQHWTQIPILSISQPISNIDCILTR